jgi:3D (Asp-Asp-Asp) domain-containing protein
MSSQALLSRFKPCLLTLPLLTNGAAGARTLTGTASAYNSTRDQTDDTPRIGACNQPVRKGENLLAVSSDLMQAGLTCGTRVHVEGFGEFVVWDGMNGRWTRRIDIYMGKDVAKADRWGENLCSLSHHARYDHLSPTGS